MEKTKSQDINGYLKVEYEKDFLRITNTENMVSIRFANDIIGIIHKTIKKNNLELGENK